MARRTITDEEIALIKAMVGRGMKNRDIQFFFNRPKRAVNSGRITDISSGKYSNSAEIARATDDELNTFLASCSPSAEVPLFVSPAAAETSSPLSETTLQRTGFGVKHPAPWMRAVAGLANNRGGYIFFGVGDKDPAGVNLVLGLTTNEFADTDP
ncbi:MAG: ATP-binding protein, partial [Geminicoccaceae bacterium]